MINFAKKAYFDITSLKKEYIISIAGSTDVITNANISSEIFEVAEALCSERSLKFGSCESSSIRFAIKSNTLAYSLVGKVITITIILAGDVQNPFVLGTYKVERDKKLVGGAIREITAQDVLYSINNADVTSWYNSLFPNAVTTRTIKQIRDSFMAHFGLEQISTELVNDGIVVGRTIEPKALSGAKVITSLCEINGVFGHITRDNKFKYIRLLPAEEALYPSNDLYPSNGLYPSDGNVLHIQGKGAKAYKSCEVEDFDVNPITQIAFRDEEGKIAQVVGTEGNTYTIDNFLIYGKSASELATIGNALLGVIGNITYTPSNVVLMGNPCYEVGDNIKLHTVDGIYSSYILERNLSGAMALMDEIFSDGTETYDEELNFASTELQNVSREVSGLNKSYSQISQTVSEISLEVGTLDGSLSRLTVTVNEISGKVEDVEGNYSTLSQTVSDISASVSTLEGNYSSLSVTVGGISTEVSKKVGDDEIISKINQSAEAITISASRINLEGYVTVDSIQSGIAFSEEGYDNQTTINKDGVTSQYNRNVTTLDPYGISVSLAGQGSSSVGPGTVSTDTLNCNNIGEYLIHWQNITINGTTYTVLCGT